jgi:hypothetical protein
MGDGGGIVGRAVNAVLVPPQAELLAELVGADLDRLVLNVTRWNKLVLLDSDDDPGDPAVLGTIEEHLAHL